MHNHLTINLIFLLFSAEKYFELVANGNDPEGWNKLAKIYVDQKGVKYYVKALKLLQKSVESNNASGMSKLGYMYEMGFGTKKNDIAAVNYYTLSVDQNYAKAQYNLGLMYEFGCGGLKKDIKKALELYNLAYKQGIIEAKERIDLLLKLK